MPVTRIELPTPYLVGPVNAWLHRGDACVLVDTGPLSPDGLGLLERGLKRAKVAWRDISAILITHAHMDHFGLGARIRDLTKARVYAQAADRPFLENLPSFHRALVRAWAEASVAHGFPREAYDKVTARYGDTAMAADPLPVDREVRDGEVLDFGSLRLEAIHTPGHTAGSCCFYDRVDRVLYSGDTVLENVTPVSFFREGSGAPVGPSNYLKSLERLEALEVRQARPGHRAGFARFRAVTARIRRHIDRRAEKVLEAVRSPASAHAASRLAFAKDGAAFEWYRFAETLGLLEMLEERNRVRRRPGPGGPLWEAIP